jgi:hypothetical protein
VDVDIVPPQHGVPSRPNGPTRSGIVVGNELQYKMGVNVIGKVVVYPLALENELRQAELWDQ